ncbi:MAG: hypothetical protein M0Z65_07010 [Firmicutes bacterium]|nr:hypothetical protein [Bacillota bacterium]
MVDRGETVVRQTGAIHGLQEMAAVADVSEGAWVARMEEQLGVGRHKSLPMDELPFYEKEDGPTSRCVGPSVIDLISAKSGY